MVDQTDMSGARGSQRKNEATTTENEEEMVGSPDCDLCRGKGWYMHRIIGEITCHGCRDYRWDNYWRELKELGFKCLKDSTKECLSRDNPDFECKRHYNPELWDKHLLF